MDRRKFLRIIGVASAASVPIVKIGEMATRDEKEESLVVTEDPWFVGGTVVYVSDPHRKYGRPQRFGGTMG